MQPLFHTSVMCLWQIMRQWRLVAFFVLRRGHDGARGGEPLAARARNVCMASRKRSAAKSSENARVRVKALFLAAVCRRRRA